MEPEKYSLYTVTLKNKETGMIFWPCMFVSTPDGDYSDNEHFSMSSNDYIAVRRKTGATCTMYRVNGIYEVARKMKFGFVERVI